MAEREIETFSLADLTEGSTLTTNVQQECFVTTCDKVKLILREYEDDKKWAQNWWNYLAMAISFALPCFTSEFKDFLFFSASTLESLFIIMSTALTIITICSGIKCVRKRKKITIEYCANRIKSDNLCQ